MTTEAKIREHRERGLEIMAQLKGACPAKTDRGRKIPITPDSADYVPSEKPIKETIAESKEWGSELTKLAEPFASDVSVRFGDLGIIYPEEIAGLESLGLVPFSIEHGETLKRHHVLMYRLEILIERMWPEHK